MPERLYKDNIVTVKDRVVVLNKIAQNHGGSVTDTGKLEYIDTTAVDATSATIKLPHANKTLFWGDVIKARREASNNNK